MHKLIFNIETSLMDGHTIPKLANEICTHISKMWALKIHTIHVGLYFSEIWFAFIISLHENALAKGIQHIFIFANIFQ